MFNGPLIIFSPGSAAVIAPAPLRGGKFDQLKQ
jgi:hypothetical protein